MWNYATLAAVCLGTVISAYLSSCINIALPDIMAELNFSADSIVWVSLSYLLPYGSMLPLTGKLGDKYGAKNMYLIGFICFSIGSFLCGTAAGPKSMIAFRVLQGIGGGILLPNAMSIVAVTFTGTARATALGLWSAMAAIGAAVGPTVGGYLIELFSWRALFFSAIPFCGIGILVSALVIAKSVRRPDIRIDFIGGALLICSVSALLIAMNQGEKEGWFSSYYIVSLFYLFAASFVLLILVELRSSSPLIDFALFKKRNFALANLISAVTFLTMMSATYLLPFFLKNFLNYNSIQAGVMMLPMTLTMVVSASLSGRLNTVIGPRPLTFMGMGSMLLAFCLLKDINTSFGAHDFFVPLAIYGFGLGLTMSPMTTCAISTLKKHQVGVGSGLLNFSKMISGSIGVVIMQVLLNRREIYHGQVIKSTLNAAHDPFSIYQMVETLESRNLFDGIFDPAAAAQAWNIGMHMLPEEYAKFEQMLGQLVSTQAAVNSFQDDFFVLACFCAFALIATLFLRNQRDI